MISEQLLDRMTDDRVRQLAKKVAAWLPGELPGWRAAPGSPGWQELEDVLRVGRDCGMSVETDFALFALLLLGRGKWRDFVAEADVQEMLRAPQIDPPSKLMWLEDRAALPRG